MCICTYISNMINGESMFLLGLYCSGWLKTGPAGVIATTMNNSFDTARSLVEDVESGALDVSAARSGSQTIRALLEDRGNPVCTHMSAELCYLTCEFKVRSLNQTVSCQTPQYFVVSIPVIITQRFINNRNTNTNKLI